MPYRPRTVRTGLRRDDSVCECDADVVIKTVCTCTCLSLFSLAIGRLCTSSCRPTAHGYQAAGQPQVKVNLLRWSLAASSMLRLACALEVRKAVKIIRRSSTRTGIQDRSYHKRGVFSIHISPTPTWVGDESVTQTLSTWSVKRHCCVCPDPAAGGTMTPGWVKGREGTLTNQTQPGGWMSPVLGPSRGTPTAHSSRV